MIIVPHNLTIATINQVEVKLFATKLEKGDENSSEKIAIQQRKNYNAIRPHLGRLFNLPPDFTQFSRLVDKFALCKDYVGISRYVVITKVDIFQQLLFRHSHLA